MAHVSEASGTSSTSALHAGQTRISNSCGSTGMAASEGMLPLPPAWSALGYYGADAGAPACRRGPMDRRRRHRPPARRGAARGRPRVRLRLSPGAQPRGSAAGRRVVPARSRQGAHARRRARRDRSGAGAGRRLRRRPRPPSARPPARAPGAPGLGLANSAMLPACGRLAAVRGAPARVLPVALEDRFRPGGGGSATRERLGIPLDAVVSDTIGKLDRGRGHDLFIHALAAAPGVWGMIIGKGPYLDALHTLAGRLRVTARLVFPGYVEAGLEELYAAMDIFVFPAAGSDHAHRAIAEAAGCGVPSLAADLLGVRDLVEPGVTGDIYPATDAAALAVLIAAWARNSVARRAAPLS